MAGLYYTSQDRLDDYNLGINQQNQAAKDQLGHVLGIEEGGSTSGISTLMSAAGPAIMGGTAGAVGGGWGAGLSSAFNMFSQYQANQQNMGLAQKQMDFQQQMSSTAHQREMQDLISAGLNPNLSAGGNGSSTPSGASAEVKPPQIDFPAYMQAQQLNLEMEKVGIMKANSAADIAKTMSDTDLNKMRKVLAQKGMIRANLEGEASGIISNMLKYFKEQYNASRPPSWDPLDQFPNRQLPLPLKQP